MVLVLTPSLASQLPQSFVNATKPRGSWLASDEALTTTRESGKFGHFGSVELRFPCLRICEAIKLDRAVPVFDQRGA